MEQGVLKYIFMIIFVSPQLNMKQHLDRDVVAGDFQIVGRRSKFAMSWDALFRVLAVVSAYNFPKKDFMLQCYRAKLVPFVWNGVLYLQCVENCGFLIRRASKFTAARSQLDRGL